MNKPVKIDTVIRSANTFAAWVADAAKGESCVYAPDATALYGVTEARDELARAAWRYSENGLVNLVQRRVSPSTNIRGGSFDYIAQRTGRVA